MSKIFTSNSLNFTKNVAFDLAQTLSPGDILLFYGDIGAGKTTFIKFIAQFFSFYEVSSPTFSILNIYNTDTIDLYHFDLYRLSEEDELYEIGYEEFFFSTGITLIEWSEKLDNLMPTEKIIKIFLKYIDKSKREIIIERVNY